MDFCMNAIRKFVAYNIAANYKFSGTCWKNRYTTKELAIFMFYLLRFKQNFTWKNGQDFICICRIQKVCYIINRSQFINSNKFIVFIQGI